MMFFIIFMVLAVGSQLLGDLRHFTRQISYKPHLNLLPNYVKVNSCQTFFTVCIDNSHKCQNEIPKDGVLWFIFTAF